MKSLKERIIEVKGAINKMAYKVSSSSYMEFDDAKQEMIISVWRSHTAFDESRGTKFSTYAIECMKNRSKTLLRRNIDPKHPIPFSNALELFPDETNVVNEEILNTVLLDKIEEVLRGRQNNHLWDKRAYLLLRYMRKGKTMIACAKKWDVSVSLLSRIFREKVKSLKGILF